jgi:acyl-coenzyme A thioesterase PaaI-like protein
LIAALCDGAIGYSCMRRMAGASSVVRVGLAVDCARERGPQDSTICFAQCLVTADDTVIARGNATFRMVPTS